MHTESPALEKARGRTNPLPGDMLLGIGVAGVGYSVERGEIIARENDYRLIEQDFENFKGVPLKR